MKKAVYIILLVLSSLMLTCLCVVGCGTVIPIGFVDSPCFASYDTQKQCINLYGPKSSEESLQNAHIQVFRSIYSASMKGASCKIETSDTDLLDINFPAYSLAFERIGDNLKINGQELASGASFAFTQIWNINPWTIYHVEFTNYGVTKICGSDVPPRTVIVGSSGTEVSWVKAGIILFFPLGATILFAVLLISLRRKKVQ